MGVKFVERGDFELIRSDDYQIVDYHNLADAVQPGMTLEMSIILREGHNLNPKICPRCGHMNAMLVTKTWVEWQVFSYM